MNHLTKDIEVDVVYVTVQKTIYCSKDYETALLNISKCKLYIGDLWGKLKTEMIIFPFFHNGQFSISVNTQRSRDPNFGVNNLKFWCTTIFCKVRAIFLFSHNGNFSIFS